MGTLHLLLSCWLLTLTESTVPVWYILMIEPWPWTSLDDPHCFMWTFFGQLNAEQSILNFNSVTSSTIYKKKQNVLLDDSCDLQLTSTVDHNLIDLVNWIVRSLKWTFQIKPPQCCLCSACWFPQKHSEFIQRLWHCCLHAPHAIYITLNPTNVQLLIISSTAAQVEPV